MKERANNSYDNYKQLLICFLKREKGENPNGVGKIHRKRKEELCFPDFPSARQK